MMVVKVVTDPTFRADRPQVLFEGDFARATVHAQYDVAPNGERS
jgi:hypothetical protein